MEEKSKIQKIKEILFGRMQPKKKETLKKIKVLSF